MKSIIHGVVGTLAMLSIAVFWSSTLVSELFLDQAAVVFVKKTIVYGLCVVVATMAATGASGISLSRRRGGRIVDRKKKRMAVIAFNGVLIMMPCALFLSMKAHALAFDSAFYVVQTIELSVGAIQLWLMSQSMRDGLTLAGKLRKPTASAS